MSRVLLFMVLLIAIYGCSSNTKEDTITMDSTTDLYSIGMMPDTDFTVPSIGVDYGKQTVCYPYLVERGMVIDSVFIMRSMPDNSLKMPIFKVGDVQGWPLINATASYLREYNPKLWQLYFENGRCNLFGKSDYTPVSVYYWNYEDNYVLELVCIYISGAERVIYGNYSQKYDYYDNLRFE